ncbi:hypothetical protein ACTODO_01894 [Schaalia dentiphila ATCC 17982]|uniref:Uncharacterized protein n=1 Tax=Schaalia dentiphila ATCC 17982 TaxID=411466 RepID=A7BDZ4_9ACTO|nr:hypothetical protein ACTODO_01894 [Schaalia odontolytica ATCC 17982]
MFHRSLPGCQKTRPGTGRRASRASRDAPARCNGTRSSCHRAPRPAGDVSRRARPRVSAWGAPGLVDEVRGGPGGAGTQTWAHSGTMGL